MRLPWPFNKAQRAAAAPADSTDVSSVRPKGPQAWRDLPALQRSVGEPPLIAPTPPFRDELAGAAPAPIALAPLSHGHGLEAPAGIAHNIVTAVAAVSGTELAPLRRRPSAVAISSLEDAPEQRADVEHRDASPATSPHAGGDSQWRDKGRRHGPQQNVPPSSGPIGSFSCRPLRSD